MVDVSKQEVVNRPIPVPSILLKGYGIPPWTIEAPIGKSRELR